MKKIIKYFTALSVILALLIQHPIFCKNTLTKASCDCADAGETFGSCGSCGGNWCSVRPLCGPCTPRSGPCPCGKCRCKCGPCGEYDETCICCAATACGSPFFAYRSTSINAARDNAGINPFINRYGMDATSGVFSVALEYTRSFRPNHIAQFLFGTDLCCNRLAIQGSNVIGQNRMCCAWLADYFGLSPAFDSRVSFCPRIENVIVNLDLYLGLDGATEGLYFRIHSPITWTRWNLNMHECILNLGSIDDEMIGFAHGYMSEDEIIKEKLPRSFTEALSGCTTWGDMQTPLCYGRMSCCPQTLTRLADIHTVFGWNFLLDADYHMGINLRAIFPTGNKPCPIYLFAPQVGDRRHWQLGGGITSSWIIWRNEKNYNNYVGLYFDANLLHLLTNCQCRSFDFCCKPNSRYTLLAHMGVNEDAIGGETEVANYQYKQKLMPAIHYTTFNTKVVIDVQADLVFKLGYVKDHWSFDIGYNFWGRTGERFIQDNCCCCAGCWDDIKYAIKGDSILYGYQATTTIAYAMSSSQGKADIHAGQNMKLTSTTERIRNKGIDNPTDAYHKDTNTSSRLPLYFYEKWALQMYTSVQPELISCDDINLCKSPSAISHKIFTHINYMGKERDEQWTPYFGIGAEAEFDNSNATRFSVAQWGIWFKSGIAFE